MITASSHIEAALRAIVGADSPDDTHEALEHAKQLLSELDRQRAAATAVPTDLVPLEEIPEAAIAAANQAAHTAGEDATRAMLAAALPHLDVYGFHVAQLLDQQRRELAAQRRAAGENPFLTYERVPMPPKLDSQRQTRVTQLKGYLYGCKNKYPSDGPEHRMLVNIGAQVILIEGDESW